MDLDGSPFALTHAPTSCLSDTCNNAIFFFFFFFYLTQTAQTMLRPKAISCAYGHPQVPHHHQPTPIYSSVGTQGRQRGAVWGETLHGSSKIIFLSNSLGHDKTRALINSSQCDTASHEKVDSDGIVSTTQCSRQCRLQLRKSFWFYPLMNNTSANKSD